MRHVSCPPNSTNDGFMSGISSILNTALTDFPNSIFYVIGDFNYDLFSISSNKRHLNLY